MEPVNSYWGMLNVLGDAFRNRYTRPDVNLTGILLARPSSEFAQRQILPHIDYWHHRSDRHTDFFCPGYLCDDSGQSGPVVANVGGSLWCFRNQDFVTFLAQLEPLTSWRYRGGCELIITNARYDADEGRASLDLSTAMAVDLEAAHRDKAIRDVTDLCEALFEFAKNLNEDIDDPCWKFSDQLGIRVATGSLKELLIRYLPGWIKPEARKAFHFVTSDLQVRV